MTKPQGYYRSLPIIALLCALIGFSMHFFSDTEQKGMNWLQLEIEQNIAREVGKVDKEAARIVETVGESNLFSRLTDVQGSFFLFDKGKPVYWSEHRIFPEYFLLSNVDDLTYVRWVSGHYLVKRYSIASELELYAIIELYHDTRITNNYLSAGFNERIFPKEAQVRIVESEDAIAISTGSRQLFSIQEDGVVARPLKTKAVVILILISLSFILLGTWVWRYLALRARGGEFESSFFLWFSFLILLRYLMLVFEFPDSILETGLFGSMFFASSRINPSLGDMLINGFVLMLIALFIYRFYTRSKIVKSAMKANMLQKWIFSILAAIFGYFVIWYPHVVIQTIYFNSQLTLDITESNSISYPRVVSLLIFVTSAFTLFLVLHVKYRVQIKVFKKRILQLNAVYIVAAILFVAYQIWTRQHYWIVVIAGISYLNILYFTRIYRSFTQWRYQSFIYVFSVLALTSILGSYGIYEFERDRVENNKERFADYFLIKNDNLTEFFLNEVNEKIKRDVFISSRMASPFLSKDIIEEKIRRVYLGTVFDKYEIQINLYNNDGDVMLGNPSEEELSLLSSDSISSSFQTDYPNIYFLNRSKGDIVKRYINKIAIERRENVAGYITMDFQLKKIIPNDVYFELLVDNRFIEPFLGQEYSYAIYSNSHLTYSSGKFNYLTDMTLDQLQAGSPIFKHEIVLGEYSHIALKDMENRIIVVSTEVYPLEKVITNFSFLFLLQVFFLILIALFYSILMFWRRVSLNYTSRIQVYFNLGFFIPLLAVSGATLSLMNSTFKEEVRHEHGKKADNIASNITEPLDQFIQGKISEDEFNDNISLASRFADADVNLFSISGKLMGTSKPLIYENNLLSDYINPVAISTIREQNENEWITEETVGTLTYNVNYLAIKSFSTGELIGVLSVPYFESEVHLENQQIEVLSTIINIFTVVFIIFLFISYFVSKGLTFPLRLITTKLRKTTLTGHNAPLSWDADDEIGLMVGEYNKMVENLEESKRELAKSQKESAWRDMAQQVAHEIKNPLTPMKLTLQHLHRKLGSNGGDDTDKPINTLLHHVETLDDIATSFSSLAKMPIPENEPFEFVSLVRQTVDLYKNMEGVTLDANYSEEEVTVDGDKKLMGRIVSNILLNAVQSASEGSEVTIEVNLTVGEKKVLLEVKDNGVGIDEDVRNKVFVPNFTTKDSGSGIGLAIAKHGIELAGGKIWYESKLDAGTSFFIELPRQ